jgi:hypothetical protein
MPTTIPDIVPVPPYNGILAVSPALVANKVCGDSCSFHEEGAAL